MNIVEFAIRRRVTILMLTVALLLFGVVSLLRLKVDLLPDLSYPTLTVRTSCPAPRRWRSRTSLRGQSRKPSASSATCAMCAQCRAPGNRT